MACTAVDLMIILNKPTTQSTGVVGLWLLECVTDRLKIVGWRSHLFLVFHHAWPIICWPIIYWPVINWPLYHGRLDRLSMSKVEMFGCCPTFDHTKTETQPTTHCTRVVECVKSDCSCRETDECVMSHPVEYEQTYLDRLFHTPIIYRHPLFVGTIIYWPSNLSMGQA